MDIYQAHRICFQWKLDMWHFKVPIWMAYLLLLFCGLAYSCGSAEYEIYGECCPMCTPGTRVYKHCTEYTSTSCVPCTQKSFSAMPNGLSHCLSCTVCEPDLGLKTERSAPSPLKQCVGLWITTTALRLITRGAALRRNTPSAGLDSSSYTKEQH
ncbi:hypothetical protein ANANG_G00319560 [Anguilla anguilla]|uniref:TNFR-Cys domain-containing protein n=1 Tax=Anguilla anguilla TaxID=7936 RepID=A0A9D3LHG7_ANGAN|nr:hypothetical protein ANANG_G00319560 [Anguilla anguilla]